MAMRGWLTGLIVASVSAVCLGPVRAADLTAPPPPPVFVPTPPPVTVRQYSFLSEARFGVFAHGVATAEYGSVGLNGELLSVKPFTVANPLWNYFIPQFHVGGDLDTGGHTSDVYGGLTWQFPIYQRVFGELTFGGSGNDGKAGLVVPAGNSRVGCNVLFRESVSLGYRLSEHWNIMATAEHMSNASLCQHNEGISNIGARLGYVF